MSLETVIKIGKALRESDNNLKNFKYVNSCPKTKDGEYSPTCISIPIKEDLSIDWNKVKLLPENEKPLLFYLRFKTSDSDSSMKYIFGDIYYLQTSKISKTGVVEKGEGGIYRLGNAEAKPKPKKSSFERGEADFKDIIKNYDGSVLNTIRNNFESDLEIIETILANISATEEYLFENIETPFLDFVNDEVALSNSTIKRLYEKKISTQNFKKLGIDSKLAELSDIEKEKILAFDFGEIFIHFEFPENKKWYEYKKEFNLITNKMLADFVESSENGVVLKKTLYKTLCSGDHKNDWQFPDFDVRNKHKSKSFTDDEIQDLFYAIDYCSKGRTISGTNVKIILLPKGEKLTAENFETFKENRDESRLKKNNTSENNDDEPLFDFFEKEEEEDIVAFDVIFCKKGGTSSPDVDLLEISGIEKSKIKTTRQRLERISKEIAVKRKAFLRTDKDLFPFKLEYSFRNILGNPLFDMKTNKVTIKANPKYQSHILKVLPLIYTDNYHRDDVLLSAFIQNIEYSIRSGDNKFNLLKFDLEFLITIQNSEINKFKKMIDTKCFQLGKQLGQLSKPLRKKINSFEKSYVGLITRRVATKYDCIKFTNEMTEKLTRNGSRWAEMISIIVNELAVLPESEYDKELVAFGFLSGYFTYEEQSADTNRFYSRLEKLLNDFEDNGELENVIQNISTIANSQEEA